jgi:hypothetical protein
MEFFPEGEQMDKTFKKVLVVAGVGLLLSLPSVAGAKIEGNCFTCHTETNGPQGVMVGPLQNTDCVGCHAMGGDQKIVTLPGGIQVPQVYHFDRTGDLAGGNFRYVADDPGIGPTGSRKGHDPVDLFPGDFEFPPGFIHGPNPSYFRKITCAGMNGCHGIRNQLMVGPKGHLVPRVGLAAIQGAHHGNVDGSLKVADTVANSYRFLLGVQGLEQPYAPDRWQNVTPFIHNEYFDDPFPAQQYRLCSTCHFGSPQATLTSYIKTPRNSISAFCETCHSQFHSSEQSMAFLRHPADFVIPNTGEYANYRTYELTAPVARPTVYEQSSDIVNPGRDIVMCLTCHEAHASPYDGMLRFDYSKMVAGHAGSAAGTGCFACHTSKGGR